MKIWNKPRSSGKTMRMLYVSEYTGCNIIVSTRERALMLESTAIRMGLNIPQVLAVPDFLDRCIRCSDAVIIDEGIHVLNAFITAARPGTKISDITLTCHDGVRETE